MKSTVGEYLVFKNGSTSPDRSSDGIYPVYGSNGVIGRANSCNVSEPCVVIGRVGSYCGSLYFNRDKCHVTDNAIIALPKQESNIRYWYYALSFLNLHNLRHGSGQPLLNQTILKQIAFNPAPVNEQRGIAATLGILDDKIESNIISAELSESLADSLAEKILSNFAVQTQKLGDIASFNRCTVKPGSTESIRYVDISSVAPRVIKSVQNLTWAEAPSHARRGVSDGDVIFSTVRPERRAFILIVKPHPHMVVSTGFAVITPKVPIESSMLSYIVGTKTFAEYLEGATTGSAYPAVSVSAMGNYEVVIPEDEHILADYEAQTMQLRVNAHQKLEENRTLASLRDALLPELMSGRIRVSEAREAVQDATGSEVSGDTDV